MDIKAVVHFRPQWEGALHLVEPTTRSVKSMRPLKEPFRTALQPVYDGLAISSGRTSSLHWRRLAVTALELSAGLVPGLLLAAQIGPALDPLAERFYSLRIFSKPRVAFLDAVPGLYGAALRQEIRRSERVRAWFETAPVVELEQIGARVASGLPRLSNELLEQRAELVGAILDKLDPESCGIFVRGIAGLSAKSLAGEDVLKLIETYLGPSGINRWAHITVKSLEADLMNLPARRPTQDDVRLAVTELLDRLPGTESVRMAESLQNYASSAPVEMCWVERKINHTRPQLSEVSREALLRAPFGTER